MKKQFLRIINVGVNSQNNEDTNEFIKLINGISLLGFPICFYYTVLFIILGYPYLVMLFTIGIPLFILPIIINKFNNVKRARFILCTFVPIYFLIITIALGRESGFYLSFLVITAPPILFFDSLKKAMPYIWFGILCFILSFLGIAYFNPEGNLPFSMMIYITNLFMVLSTQLLLVVFFKTEITSNRLILRVKNKEILDSIAYAKRIQEAILPQLKLFHQNLNEIFVLYKPKDVVAGDFYWMELKNNKVLFAAADCTGHGVPGAMVSVVCNNALNRAVREHGLTIPGEILTKTREIVIQEFEKSEEDVKDGMDIALCALEGNKLQYAGAHNPLWIIRNGEIIETKANKQPIGQFDNPEPYTTHSFNLEQGDSLYIFSDGYIDQFGGEKGKKFKAKAFRKLLLSIQDKSMEEQKTVIDESFETWRGNLEQIDDVCVIGVRF